MCLLLWVASEQPIPLVSLVDPQTPDPENGYHRIDDVATDAPVRARFSLPHLRYVGSHEGCGCGYNSSELAWTGLVRVDDITPLYEAMSSEERESFDAEQKSRKRLRAIVERALAVGAVEVFACWSGDEVDPATSERDVEPSYFTEYAEPIEERVRYRVVRA